MPILFGCWSKSSQTCWETQQSSNEAFGKTWSRHSLWFQAKVESWAEYWLSVDKILNVGATLALSHSALPTGDMSLCIYLRVPQVADFQWLDRPFPQPCAEFSGVESLSDIMDGDPPESMRLGNQGSPSIWQKRGGWQEWEEKEESCVRCACVNLRLQINSVCLAPCHGT